MYHIRPYKLFNLIQGPPPERIIHTAIPSRRGAGGVSLLEMFLMVAASRIVEAKRLFEFGTFLGSTTLNLVLNVPDDSQLFTLDLGEHDAGEAKQDTADAPLTEIHLAAKSLDFQGSPVANKIKTLTGNSITFDFSPWHGSVDFVFIDGGHDFATVKSDSENALQMACKEKASCVLWHDYRNPEYSGLSHYLDGLSQQVQLVHVEDTILCAWFNDPCNRIWPGLLRTD